RDLKPANILRVGRTWKIADFGTVVDLDGASLKGTQARGTPAYAPPEAFSGNHISTAWDIWSLGMIIFEALTGRLPTGDTAKRRPIAIPFQQITDNCLIADRSRRWTAQQVMAALRGGPTPRVATPHALLASRTLRIGIFGTNAVGKTA